MKKNDLAEIKKMAAPEIADKVAKVQKELAGLVLDKNMGKLPNLRAIKNKRKEAAQLVTVMAQKRLLEQLEVKDGPK